MKVNIQYLFFSLIGISLLLAGCKKDKMVIAPPVITVDAQYQNIEGLNAGSRLSIPVQVTSAVGLKRLAYFIVTATANGTSSGDPVYIDKTDAPSQLNETIEITVGANFKELVIIAFDTQHNNSEIHITSGSVRSVQVISFKDGIRHRASVFEGKRLAVAGEIRSEHDLSEVSYQTIINQVASAATPVAIPDKKILTFDIGVDVVKELTAIIVNSKNIYDAVVTDTFTIASVQDDAVIISLEENNNKIQRLYTSVENTLKGNAFSGTDIQTLTYSIKRAGVYGEEKNLPIGTPADEFPFEIKFQGEENMEGIRIKGQNENGKTADVELLVDKIYRPLKVFKNVVLTTEIGPGKKNFFSAYKEPHVFEAGVTAAANDVMIDLGFFKYTATSNNIMPPAVYVAGAAYANALAPYLIGFKKAPYTLVTANRPSVNNASFDTLNWDTQLLEHVALKVAAPANQGGEGYNIYETNRRTNNVFNVGQGFYIGWGQWEPIRNEVFGIVIVRDYKLENGIATVTLDIKVPQEDVRTKFNPLSLFDYP